MARLARRNALRDTRGASLVEYLVLIGLIAVVVLGGYRAFSTKSDAKVTAQAACVTTMTCAEGGKPGAKGSIAPSDGSAPVVGESATPKGGDSAGGKSFWRNALDFGKGFVFEAWDTVKGIVHIVLHPIETVKGLWTAVTHPVATYHAIKDAVVDAWNENPAEFLGRAVFEVVTLPITATKASKLKFVNATRKAGEAAAIADKAGDVARVSSKLGKILRIEEAGSTAVGKLRLEILADPARAAAAEKALAKIDEAALLAMTPEARALRQELLALAVPESTRPALLAAIRSDLAATSAKTGDFLAANPETRVKRVIIGGGPQGQTIANELHRMNDGTSTLLIDATKGDQNFGSIRNFDLNSKGPDSPLHGSPIQVTDLTDRPYPNAGTFGDASTIGLYGAMRQGTDVLTDTKVVGIVESKGASWPGRYRIDMVDAQGRALTVYTDEVVAATGLGKPTLVRDPGSLALAKSEMAKVAKNPAALKDVRIITGEDLLRDSNFVTDQAAFYRASDGPIYFVGAGDAAKTAVEHFGDVTKGGARPPAKWVGIKDEDLWSRYAKARELVESGAVEPAAGRLSKIEEIEGTNKLKLTFDTPDGPVTQEAGKVVLSVGMKSDVPDLMAGVVKDFDPKVHLEPVKGIDSKYPDQRLAQRVPGQDIYVVGVASGLGRAEGVSWLEYYGHKNVELVQQVLAKGPKEPSPISGVRKP